MDGMGVMIRQLSGNQDAIEIYNSCLNKTIKQITLDDNKLKFVFDDDSTMAMLDNGQSCCEFRYMQTDDDLNYFIGAKFLGAQIKDAPDIEDESGECHEVQFLEILTDKGSFVMANHNEHNGYYGGFYIDIIKI